MTLIFCEIEKEAMKEQNKQLLVQRKTKNFMHLRIIYVIHWNFGKDHKYANA